MSESAIRPLTDDMHRRNALAFVRAKPFQFPVSFDLATLFSCLLPISLYRCSVNNAFLMPNYYLFSGKPACSVARLSSHGGAVGWFRGRRILMAYVLSVTAKCEKCGTHWFPDTSDRQKQCVSCNSTEWNKSSESYTDAMKKFLDAILKVVYSIS
jgi:hypothetical protein